MANGVIGKVTAGGGTHLVTSTFYGTCTTAAATAAKIVKLADATPDSATLITGMLLAVKFTNSNTAESPTLTVQRNANTTNLIAAKPIVMYGSTAAGTATGTSWKAGAIVLFVYDGTNWVITDYNDCWVHQNAAITTNGAYNLLGGNGANANEQIGSVNKLSGLTYNPSTHTLVNTGPINTGDLTISKSTSIANNYPAILNFSVTQTDNNKTTAASIRVYDDGDNQTYGTNMVINGGGNILIGGGESSTNLYPLVKSSTNTSESLYLTSDSAVFIEGGGGTIANRIGIEIDATGNVFPIKAEEKNTNAQTLGAADATWKGIYLGNGSSAYNTNGVVFTGGSRIGENTSKDLGIYGGEKIYFRPKSPTASSSTDGMVLDGDGLYPSVTNTESLGKADNKWSNVYATTVTLGRNPTANLEAATKQYVDGAISSVTLSSIGAAAAVHSHGNVENDGTMSSTGTEIANGDYLLFSDASNNGKIERSSIAFDGATTTKALSQKGTWEAMSSVTIRVWS